MFTVTNSDPEEAWSLATAPFFSSESTFRRTHQGVPGLAVNLRLSCMSRLDLNILADVVRLDSNSESEE